ncbi:fatty-acyl-CoA synthase [Panacagrimonas perspica]|uniref:Fatty-acyl-CoA synthase n=1 Tax=Panacagrimonas perspica TaxID=381431 RepID=A0A4R7NWP2_9GAMM|nr:AMP-binding protein [Panacagrimonas perspica]TDU25643.1 fatty-acyl-CoA synthase [Panacagrimonas perspica]THD03764.1 hypothetical protein B1810_07740 [Panacagrimonas perspica]
MKFDLAAWGAELTPDRHAVWFNGRWYTYRDLNERATRLANTLAATGIGFGARVGILSANDLAHFDLLFAAPKLGFIFVPFNVHETASGLREQALTVRPDLVFCEARYAELAAQAFDCPRIALAQYRAWLGNSSRQHIPMPELSPESIQMILFTSGNTGRPKAVMLPYRQTLANAQCTAMSWGLGPEDCTVHAVPCFHAGVNVLATPLLTLGGSVVLMSAFDPGEFLRLTERLEATVMSLTPTMYQRLIESPAFATTDLGRVRWAMSSGGPCPPPIARAMLERGVVFMQGYGMTEAGPNCFSIPPEDAARHPDSIGSPMPHVDVRIRRQDGEICAANEVGELTITGEGLCSGYLGRDDDWSAVCREGWFWTGDLAEQDAEGLYFIRGRRRDAYVSGGQNVYPAEVEAALVQCAGVAECAVLSIPDTRWGETGLAAIVMDAGVIGKPDQLRAELRNLLAAHKIPSVMLFVDMLPRTGSGKVDRVALRSMLEEEST